MPAICRQGVPAALFRENALLHYQACCAANRDVILSRRACGVSKNLLRLPQSDYNATMPMLRPPLSFRPKRGVKRRAERRNLSHCTYAFAMSICPCSIPSPYYNPCKILRLRASLFARHSAQDDRVGGVAPRPCSGNVPLHQVPRTSFITLHNIIPRTAGV